MAKDLGALIRLQKWRVDEQRRKLADLLRQAARIEGQRAGLERELKREQKVAGLAVDYSLTYAAYARAVIERRKRIAQALVQVERQIADEQEALGGLFRDLKSFEITQAARDRAERQRIAKLDQAMLDEFGALKFQARGGIAPRPG
ncbi:MAG: flagellar FliJ family protein [Proteobacteria bacterium]|nr:flagellar FliJ family protein [Pseudomonadota bacterium]